MAADEFQLDPAHAFQPGDYVKVRGYRGVAFTVLGLEVMYDDNGDESLTGRVRVRMVGDSRVFNEWPDELTRLERSQFCSDCGQTGCGHGREE